MMGTTTGLDRGRSWRAGREEVDHLVASHFLTLDRLLSSIHAMQLKDLLYA